MHERLPISGNRESHRPRTGPGIVVMPFLITSLLTGREVFDTTAKDPRAPSEIFETAGTTVDPLRVEDPDGSRRHEALAQPAKDAEVAER